ncbi:hypothetical protein SLEP1_g7258 [Rubroshorea leprosula]|uniref:Uncharacterized protein n=1 Tax=Rubroshorea leprosula TaxID=152421 RepID=A0AAV5I8N6_9ROSI|nr:hypothetical protein SLEP1_g7258 [Rubroshorea leprosula]
MCHHKLLQSYSQLCVHFPHAPNCRFKASTHKASCSVES